MKKILPLLALLYLILPNNARAQSINYLQIQASHIVDAGGHVVSTGSIVFQATDAGGNPISFQPGGGGATITTPVSASIVNGVITSPNPFLVANPASTTPVNIKYLIRVMRGAQQLASFPLVNLCVQGTVCSSGYIFNFDLCISSAACPAAPLPIPTVPIGATGPPGPTGATGATGTLASNSGITVGGSAVIKGPNPWRDATAYGAVSSTETFTATTIATSPNVTINAAGDWVNGQAVSIVGAGAAATVNPPSMATVSISAASRTSNVVTATVTACTEFPNPQFVKVLGFSGGHTAFNGVFWMTSCSGTTASWVQYPTGADDPAGGTGTVAPGFAFYEGTNSGSTSHTYNVCSVGVGGGCSAKSANLIVTNDPATITTLDYNWLYFGNQGTLGLPAGVDYLCVYKDGSFIGRTYVPGYKDDGEVWTRNVNCPAAAPSSATADTLTTTISSGAGTTSLVLANNAGTSGSGLFTFHDSAPAIIAAAAAAYADALANGGGGPDVVLPSGVYTISRINLEWNLEITGRINLTTHPLIVGASGTFNGHGSLVAVSINYEAADMAEVRGDIAGGIDLFLVPGAAGQHTIRGITTNNSGSHDVVLGANTSAGASGVTIENVSSFHGSGGDFLLAESNSIFVRLKNINCSAAYIGIGAATNRYCYYLTNVWAGGGWIVWDWTNIFTDFGDMYVDSPLPSQLVVGGASSQMRDFNVHSYEAEGSYSGGLITLDSGCQQSPLVFNEITTSFITVTNADPSDANNLSQTLFYFPRVGTTGCVQPILGGDSTQVINSRYIPTLGFAGSLLAAVGINGFESSTNGPDENIFPGETRIGTRRSIFGVPINLNYVNGLGADAAAADYLMPAPVAFASDNGAGATSCVAGTTYYFRVSGSDGQGWTRVYGKIASEISAAASTNGDYIGIFYGPGFEANPYLYAKYRIWYSTTPGTQTHYFETTNQGSYNFTCAAGTSGVMPFDTTAYSIKWASRTADPNWFGTSSTDVWGFGKVNPVYSLDSAGIVNGDVGFTAPKSSAPGGIANRSFLWNDTTDNRWKMNNNNGTSTDVAGLSEVPQVYNHSGTIEASAHIVQDSCVLGTNCSVTLAGSAIFTSSTTYTCTANDDSSISAVGVTQTSGSAVAFTGTGVDTIRYVCVGN